MKRAVLFVLTMMLVVALVSCSVEPVTEPQPEQPEPAGPTEQPPPAEEDPVQIEELEGGVFQIALDKGKATERVFRLSLNLPNGLLYDGNNIYEIESGVVPTAVFLPEEANYEDGKGYKVGAVGFHLEPTLPNDKDELIVYSFDDEITYVRSSDPSLPDATFYDYGGLPCFTEVNIIGGAEGVSLLKTTTLQFQIGADEVGTNCVFILWFFHEVDSIGAKVFFESIADGFVIEQLNVD